MGRGSRGLVGHAPGSSRHGWFEIGIIAAFGLFAAAVLAEFCSYFYPLPLVVAFTPLLLFIILSSVFY